MSILLKNGTVVFPDKEAVTDVLIEGNIIKDIGKDLIHSEDDEIIDCTGLYLMPGIIDTHIHGGLGKNFYDESIDLDAIMKFYASEGITSISPGLSTAPLDQLEKTAKRLVTYMRKGSKYTRIIGFGAEGPFLNPKRAGMMNPKFILTPTEEIFQRIYDAFDGELKQITVAPEMKGAHDVIKKAVSMGVAVSAGHTDATYEEMAEAVELGLSRTTHTFNAMRPLGQRDPGVCAFALNDDRINCEVICDFGHLHPGTVKLIYKAKGPEGFTAVCDFSDFNDLCRDGEGEYNRDGIHYYVRGGIAWSESGNVMANANTLMFGVRNLHSIGIPLHDISIMASLNPAKSVKKSDVLGSIEIGKLADIILLDTELGIKATFINGVKVFDGSII